MHEYARLYKTRPDQIPTDDVPTILNRQLRSGEPVNSKFNKSKVRSILKASNLEDAHKKYVYSIYLRLARVSEHLGEARGMLRQNDERLFFNRADRDIDIQILDTLLNSSEWGKNTVRPFYVDDHK